MAEVFAKPPFAAEPFPIFGATSLSPQFRLIFRFLALQIPHQIYFPRTKSRSISEVSSFVPDRAEGCFGPGSWGIRTRHDPTRFRQIAFENPWCQL